MKTVQLRKVIGIQQSLADTRWAVIRCRRSDGFQHIASGVIYIDKNANLLVKYASIYNKISELLSKHTPDVLAIESFSANLSEVETACQAVSAPQHLSPTCVIAGLHFAAALADIPVQLLSQREVHAIIGGGADAPESIVKKKVSALLGFNINDTNAATAAAVGIASILQPAKQQMPAIPF